VEFRFNLNSMELNRSVQAAPAEAAQALFWKKTLHHATGKMFRERAKMVSIILMKKALFTVILLLVAAGCHDRETERLRLSFVTGENWRGKAEIAKYEGNITRYGQKRPANLILVTVIEPFNLSQMVKSDTGRDAVDVLKQNQLLSYTTGVYRYSQMNSVFWKVRTGAFLKAVMTSQEWCGQTFKEMRRNGPVLNFRYNSYWEGEAVGESKYEERMGESFVLYDELPLVVRSDDFEKLPGLRVFPLLMSSQVNRPDWDIYSAQRRPAFTPAVVSVSSEKIQSLKGEVAARKISVSWEEGGARKMEDFYIDARSADRTLLAWRRYDGSLFQLKSLHYVPYWKMNHNGDTLESRVR